MPDNIMPGLTSVPLSAAIVFIAWAMYRMVTIEREYSRTNVRWALIFMGPVLMSLTATWIYEIIFRS